MHKLDAIDRMLAVVKTLHVNKYVPHQNQREMRRRLRQVRAGTLKGEYVSDEARYAAHGLVSPETLNLTGQ